MSDPVVLLSTGDVVGPAGGVTDNSMVLFSGTSGKLIKGNNAVVTAAGLALLDDVNAGAQRATLGLGTAATATLTTSPIDTTAGRVLKVGDFGLGTDSQATNIDPNTVRYGSVIGPVSQPNAPTIECVIWSGGRSGGARSSQLAIDHGSTARAWIRNYNSGRAGAEWCTWNEIWTTGNLVKTTSATDTTPGSMLKVGDFGLGAAVQGVDIDADLYVTSGLWSLPTGASWPNFPAGSSGSRGRLLVMAVDGFYGFQLFADRTTNKLYQRSKSGTWSAWQEIASINSPAFTGTPTAPTASAGTSTTQVATTAFVTTADNLKANINSPTFTGVPSAPTASAGTNTTQLANTAFVKASVDDAPRVGVGQTWQDVGASRVVNVTYTNSTGRPIMVFAGSGQTISSAKQWVINGLPAIMFNNSGTQTGTSGAVSAIIPAGDTYLMFSSNGNHGGWWELR